MPRRRRVGKTEGRLRAAQQCADLSVTGGIAGRDDQPSGPPIANSSMIRRAWCIVSGNWKTANCHVATNAMNAPVVISTERSEIEPAQLIDDEDAGSFCARSKRSFAGFLGSMNLDAGSC
jgi:hypothetical protein